MERGFCVGDARRPAHTGQSGGCLVDPALPDIQGLQSFGGELFHTARWNHDYDLTGKRVGVIGTGASAVQVVPSIAPQARRLAVFQRTPAWVVPKRDKRYSERARWLYARFPFLLHASRFLQYLSGQSRSRISFLASMCSTSRSAATAWCFSVRGARSWLAAVALRFNPASIGRVLVGDPTRIRFAAGARETVTTASQGARDGAGNRGCA